MIPMLFEKAISLIMLGDKEKGKNLLKQLLDRQQDEFLRSYYNSFVYKSKAELLTVYLPKQSAEESSKSN
jgi:uncharacterized protein HemY